jgi:RIO kinase 1
VSLEPGEAQPLFDRLLYNVQLLLAQNCVHGDLSPFNVLYWRGGATLIDFPQAVDPRFNPNAAFLLRRDLDNLCRYFTRYHVEADPDHFASQLWAWFLHGAQ